MKRPLRAVALWWLACLLLGSALSRWLRRRRGPDHRWLRADDPESFGAALDRDLPTGGMLP